MSFNTISAILRGGWLLNEQWATAHLPIVTNMLKGETSDFGINKVQDEPTIVCAAGSCANLYSVSPRSDIRSIEQGSYAIVNLSGPLLKSGDYCAYGMLDQAQLINRLAGATNISGIIMNIDSPGGQADGTAHLADAIKAANQRKPVLALIDDGMAASAAMWIASAAREIWVTQSTCQVGSIGVYTSVADWNSYYKTLGLNIKEVYAPQSIDKNKVYHEAVSGNDTLLQESLSVLADQFINTVETNRVATIKGDSWKTGKMFYAAEAKKIGLINGIKSLSQVIDRMTSIITNTQKSTNSTMAFEKTLAAAHAEAFAVTDEGFLLSEDNLTNIENSLATISNATATLETLTAATATIETLNATLATATETAGTQTTTIANHEATILSLNEKIVAFGKNASGGGSILSAADDTNAENEEPLSYLDNSHPLNQLADRRAKRK